MKAMTVQRCEEVLVLAQVGGMPDDDEIGIIRAFGEQHRDLIHVVPQRGTSPPLKPARRMEA
jgi:hypothetical protein